MLFRGGVSTAAVAFLLAVVAAPAWADFTPGAAGGGDPFYPQAGNGGYDVGSYSVKLDYEPQNEQLAGDVTISARSTQDLSSFNLDLRDLKVNTVTVNGAGASFMRKGQELTITPAEGIRRNRDFTVRVVYAENRYSNVTTQDFIETAERVSGQQLDHFFDVWLFQEGRPEPGSW